MKATGIVRRIDDPEELLFQRKYDALCESERAILLKFIQKKTVRLFFKKYPPIGELGDFAANYVETLAKASGHGACITDRDNVIAVSG